MTSQHTHHHKHEHSHSLGSLALQNKKILAWSLAIISGFMLIEFIGGYLFNSLTLIADASHMANDSLSLCLALIALFLSERKQTWFALINGLSLMLVALMILWEAVERWQSPVTLVVGPMLAVASVGLVVNILVARLMIQGDQENLNVKAAYLHVLADLFGSIAAIGAGLTTWLSGWQWIDPLTSAILSVLILKSGLIVVRQAIQALKK